MLPLLLAAILAQPGDGGYRALFLRAAPGRLLDLISLVQSREAARPRDERGVLLRHSQGDQWDIMLLSPVATASGFPATAPAAKDTAWDELVAWQEELFARGPSWATFRRAADSAGYYHLEIFLALAGKRDSLLAERRMENAFLGAIQLPVNFIFTRVGGAAWDCFTIGFYRDLQHYAEPSKAGAEREEAEARAAGFASRGAIGPYLRRFIQGHHDTIGPIVK